MRNIALSLSLLTAVVTATVDPYGVGCQAPNVPAHNQSWAHINDFWGGLGTGVYGWGMDPSTSSDATGGQHMPDVRECKSATECGRSPYDIANFQKDGTGILPASPDNTVTTARSWKIYDNNNTIGLRYYEQSFCFEADANDDAKLPQTLKVITTKDGSKCALAGKLGEGGLVFRCRAATWTKCLAAADNDGCGTKGIGKCYVPFSEGEEFFATSGPTQNVHRPGCKASAQVYEINTPDVCSGDSPYTEVPCDAAQLRCHMERGAYDATHRTEFLNDAWGAGPAMQEILSRIGDLAAAMRHHCKVMTKAVG